MNSIDEVLKVIAQILIRCVAMALIVLLLWWAVLSWFGDLAYAAHSGFIPLPREAFDTVHYAGIILLKAAMGIFLFIPYVAVRLVLNKRAAAPGGT